MAEHNNTAGNPRVGRRKVKSVFLLALIAFVAINAFLSFTGPVRFDRFEFPYRGWAWWTYHDLRKSNKLHNVALLGSSLMVSAINGCDANYLNKNLDLTAYHGASYLDSNLERNFGGSFDTFNLSAPGQMPSDAYLALRAMVESHNRPDVVIYGIAPRDFIDSTLSSVCDTEPFKYLHRIVNIDKVSHKIFRSVWGKLDWWLQRVVYLYGFSMDYQMCFVDSAGQGLARVLPAPYTNKPFTWWDRRDLLPTYKIGEIHPMAVMTGPVDRKAVLSRWRDNTLEYERRYRTPDKHTYKTQVYFLKKLMQYCNKERIKLVVVNMPITLYNAGMLAPGVYMKYVEAMREASFEHGVAFYDLADFIRYRKEDYYDSVHLNAFGGKKFVDHLVEKLERDVQATAALKLAGKEQEVNQAVAASMHNRTY